MRVWKFPVRRGPQTLEMRAGAQVLSVGADPQGDPCLWALVDPEARPEAWFVMVAWTNDVIPAACLRGTRFLGTAVTPDGLVWHVWMREKEAA